MLLVELGGAAGRVAPVLRTRGTPATACGGTSIRVGVSRPAAITAAAVATRFAARLVVLGLLVLLVAVLALVLAFVLALLLAFVLVVLRTLIIAHILI